MAKLWEEHEAERAALRDEGTINLGKSINLINKPDHQRFWLPNRDYWYEMQLVKAPKGLVWRHRIVHNETLTVQEFLLQRKGIPDRIVTEWDIPAHHINTSRWNLASQQLAERRYPRPVKRDREGKKLKDPVLYDVVNVKDRKKGLMPKSVPFLHMAQQFKSVQVVKYPNDTFEIVEINGDA